MAGDGFAGELRRRREAAGLSREELAHRAQVSSQTIYRIETGRVVPTRATVAAIRRALGEADGSQ